MHHSLSLRSALSRRAAAVLLLGAASAAPAAAQIDFLVSKIEVNQSIQIGNTPLTAGRSTLVRATTRALNLPASPTFIDGLLRVFVNGVETADSPIFSSNGPYQVKQPPNMSLLNDTLNFVFLPPQSSNVVLTVEVNPAGPNFVTEANTANNTLATAALNFAFMDLPELAYAPIDYRPSGGAVPNLPNPELIKPGVGDNFVQGIYPGSDWAYHRTDAPSKLWTSSLAGSGSPLLSSLEIDLNLMNPRPDFLYGWIPGGLSYNGQAVIGGDVSMGNTELIRFQRTLAHELGHNFGLFHNSTTTGLIGLDVERHLNLTQGLPQLKASSLKDIMYAGLLTHEAWVATGSYGVFVNHPAYDAPPPSAATAGEGPGLLVAGLWNTRTGQVELTDALVVPNARLSQPAPAGEAHFVLRAFADGALAHELPVAVRHSGDCSSDSADSAVQPELLGFTAVLPATTAAGATLDRLTLDPVGGARLQAMARTASPAAPAASFISPAGGDLAGPALRVEWTASDPDGDGLRFYLLYSPDGARRVPLATGVTATTHDVDLRDLPAPVAGRAFFELLASDGFRTTVVRSENLGSTTAFLGAGGNPPWVDVVAPDSGFSFPRGATVVLHSSGWDLEDNLITGEDISWTSSLDGAIGTGRLTSTADLTPGTHLLTVTASDSGALTAQASVTITVTDRGLPITGGEPVCQDDLGFAGPGSVALALCGGDLSAGTNADLDLTGAPPFSTAWLLVGATFGPTPAKGGTIVPVPWLLLVPTSTDGTGSSTITIPGGGGPLTLYIQYAVVDGSQTLGFAISNAVQADFLP